MDVTYLMYLNVLLVDALSYLNILLIFSSFLFFSSFLTERSSHFFYLDVLLVIST